MIRFTGWLSEESSAAGQPSGAQPLRLAVKQLASPAATANTRRGWSKPIRAAALFSVCVCATSTANAQWTITDLGDLPGGSSSSYAWGINNSGQVVGRSTAATGDRAFLWQNGVMTNLGDLPGGIDYSQALGINNAGQVVGYSSAATGNSAFLWQNGVMTNLSTVSGVAGTGWRLTEAAAINDAGQIVGYGNNPQGVTSAFILTPVPEPEVYLMMGAGVCLAGVIARRRKQIG
jgi:probable HAF family extracellular repeat protein